MRAEEIINSLKVCAGAGRCDNCEYRHETYQEGCEVKLNKDAALRLEELCDQIEEYETISQWAELLGIKRSTLSSRICRGWTIEKALARRNYYGKTN